MIKLIQNELIKIFKRKSIYLLLFLSVIVIIIFNNVNPNQNKHIVGFETKDINYVSYPEESKITNVTNKNNTDFIQLYNKYEENSWQRYALNEERNIYNFNNKEISYHKDIEYLINIINSYELNNNTEFSLEDYNIAKVKYRNYLMALDSNDWKSFVKLKIYNLIEKKDLNISLSDDINILIDTYQLRLNNDIPYANDIFNQYIEEYMSNNYILKYYENIENPNAVQNKYITEYKSRIALIKYALDNKINQDISPENYILIYNNKIDARNSFIRTFKNFDILIIIITIYISSIILTEEFNKYTIKSLLIKPHKRFHILISKIIASILVVIFAMIFIIISQYLIGGIYFGFSSYELEFIGYNYNSNQILTMSLFHYVILVGLTKLPMYILIIVICMFIGIINDNISMSIILSFIIYFLSSYILINISTIPEVSLITRYFITNNWDFSLFLFGQISNINGISLVFSLIIYTLHLLFLLILLILKFNNKEINNI